MQITLSVRRRNVFVRNSDVMELMIVGTLATRKAALNSAMLINLSKFAYD